MRHFLIIAVLTMPALAQSERLLDAIRQVESGGDCTLIGDGGKAIGPYQIHREYWHDAIEADKTLGGTYQDCTREDYARRVVKAYLKRYGRGKTDEQLARIHNGGPGAMKAKPGTQYARNLAAYWAKVKNAMRRSK